MSKVKCPECSWEPNENDIWQCEKCRSIFNTFKTKAKCPNEKCGNSWKWTQCRQCFKRTLHKD